MIKICIVCGSEFEAKRDYAKYCSATCKNHSRYAERRAARQEKYSVMRQRAVELYYSDLSVNDIANLMGVSATFVYSTWEKEGLPKRLTVLQKKVLELRKKGKCKVEISEILGLERKHIHSIAKSINMPFSEEETERSKEIGKIKAVLIQHGSVEERKNNQKKFIRDNFPGWKYIDGFRGGEGKVKLLCLMCNKTSEHSAVSIRHKNNIICPTCAEIKKKETEAKRKEELQKREEEKKKKFWTQCFEQNEIVFKKCHECGAFFIPKNGHVLFCSTECKTKNANRKRDKRIHRAQKIDKTITLKKLFIRDDGKCWLCGDKCDYDDYKIINGCFIAGKNYPSIDHVYPLAKGGNHVWGNVRLAHHYCNTIKRDKVVSYG